MFECAPVLAARRQVANAFNAISRDNWCFVRNLKNSVRIRLHAIWRSLLANAVSPRRLYGRTMQSSTGHEESLTQRRERPTDRPTGSETQVESSWTQPELRDHFTRSPLLLWRHSNVVRGHRVAMRRSNDLVNNWVRQLFRNKILGLI